MTERVLVVGGGGREHALAWKVAASPQVEQVLVAPGNAGTAVEPKIRNVPVAAEDIDGLLALAQAENITLTIVGPEAPLAAGIVDRFQAASLACFGPTADGAQLESSKAFTKDFLARHQIPTAEYQNFTEVEAACAYIQKRGAPIVVKADGLAAGKGVVVAQTTEEAEQAARDMLSANAFGDAGSRIVVEDFLAGEEASFIAIVDGEQVLPMASSQDHKAAFDGDTGPNTGGMGAYSPAPVVTAEMHEKILDQVIRPTVAGLVADGLHFTGFLYAGIMIDSQGNPRVLEFNVRMGDPETQPIMMRLQSDLVSLIRAALEHRLDTESVAWDSRAALGVVMAAGGYPGSYNKGDFINGLTDLSEDDAKVFHAGTQSSGDAVVTNGGRVFCVCALGDSVQEAANAAYATTDKIRWPGVQYRSDIGHRAIAREQSANSQP